MEKKKLSTKAFEPKYKLDIRPICTYEPHSLFEKPENSKYIDIIDYNVKLSNGKNLQRDFVWSIEQKRSLIVSILKQIQIPNFAVVIYRPGDRQTTIYKIIDGKQRLKSIEEFMKGEFGLIVDGEEYFYTDLDEMARYRFRCASLNFNIIYEYDDVRLSDEQLISWFELVNFAGTQQDIDHLEKLKS